MFFRKNLTYLKRDRTIYLDCIAIKAVRCWQHWLISRHFKIFSDHTQFEKVNIKSRSHEKLGDVTFYLSNFDFEIIYYPDKSMLEADCLSKNHRVSRERTGRYCRKFNKNGSKEYNNNR